MKSITPLLTAALCALALPAFAQPMTGVPGGTPGVGSPPIVAPVTTASLPDLESFSYERSTEFGRKRVQMSLELTRQPDGTYVANVGGENHTERRGVIVQLAELDQLRLALNDMESFPTDSFRSTGNFRSTKINAKGMDQSGASYDYDRYFVDTNDPALDAQAADFEAKVKALVDVLEKRVPLTKRINPWTRSIVVTTGAMRSRVLGPVVSGPTLSGAQPLRDYRSVVSGGTMTPVTPATPVTPVTVTPVTTGPTPAANPAMTPVTVTPNPSNPNPAPANPAGTTVVGPSVGAAGRLRRQ